MSLYRTYRPKTFAEVVGQDAIVTTLENAVKQGQIAHAYLFSGIRGTGKTSVARILAKAILTQGIEDEVLRAQIIKGVEEGTIVDLLEVDAASHTQVENIRDLIEKIQFAPVVARAKVYIIDEVHMLSKSAFNALLKTLEEPPPYAYFILATTSLHKVLDTIQSRCQRFIFRRIAEADIIRHLQHIASQERIDIDRPALRAIARHVQGGMRDAIALLDQLRTLPKITLKDVEQRIGETGEEFIEPILEALQKGDRKALVETVQRMEDAAIPLENFLRKFLELLRGNLRQSIQEGEDPSLLLKRIDTLLAALRDLRIAPLPGLVLESTLLSLLEEEGSRKGSRLWMPRRKEGAEERTVDIAAAPEPTPPATVEAIELSLTTIQGLWSKVLEEIAPAAVRMSLRNCRLHSLDGKTLTLTFNSAFHRDKVSQTEASRTIERVLDKHLRQSVKLRCTLDEEGEGAPEVGDVVNLAEAAEEVFGDAKR